MTENLALPLTQGTPVEASYGTTTTESISTFTYTPTSTAMNGNTVTPRVSSDAWNGYYYYNWYAATAEKGTSSTGANIDIDGSICPKGWRLPANYSVDTTRSWGALTGAYLNITTNTDTNTGYLYLEASPIALIRVGQYRNTVFQYPDYGMYWSSTVESASYAYALNFATTHVSPQYYSPKSQEGYQIRCLAVR